MGTPTAQDNFIAFVFLAFGAVGFSICYFILHLGVWWSAVGFGIGGIIGLILWWIGSNLR
jgi:hypothetical protein